jgi:SAM-dependent methyltransferase
MGELCLSSFDLPAQHEAVSDIIRRRSTNALDVREALLDGLELSGIRTVLDLGCGFGFMTEAIARRVPPGACFVGMDACSANEGPFLARLAAAGRSAQFMLRRIEHQLDVPDKSFDVVVASYTLYFFPEVLPEVARVVARHGTFLAVTHTEASCRDLADLMGLPGAASPLLSALCEFSAESGAERLAPWFEEVVRLEYGNALVFDACHEDELLTYLRFKLWQLAPRAALAGELAEGLARAAEALAYRGRVVLEKNDVAFRCTRPRCR